MREKSNMGYTVWGDDQIGDPVTVHLEENRIVITPKTVEKSMKE